jgi:hypothetical protein
MRGRHCTTPADAAPSRALAGAAGDRSRAVRAVVVPMRLMGPTPTEAASTAKPAAGTVAPATQAATPIRSARAALCAVRAIRGLLAIARDDRVSSGAAVEVAPASITELARIDRTAARTRAVARTPARAVAARVDVLGRSSGFESTRRWLAVHGQRYDGALVRAD